jgi:hypothetical protein
MLEQMHHMEDDDCCCDGPQESEPNDANNRSWVFRVHVGPPFFHMQHGAPGFFGPPPMAPPFMWHHIPPHVLKKMAKKWAKRNKDAKDGATEPAAEPGTSGQAEPTPGDRREPTGMALVLTEFHSRLSEIRSCNFLHAM